MKNNALITMKGKQEIDGETSTYEFTTVGNYVKRNNKYYISYEGTELTGYAGSTTTLKIADDFVSMIRLGEHPSQMVFKNGDKNVGYYNTPFGAMTVGVLTKKMLVDINDDGGEIKLDYFMELNQQMPVRNGLELSIRKVENQ